MANLVELFDNIVQMQNLNGVPLANGKMYVYALGRTRLMDTWSDVDGESLNSNPIILDAAGQCHCYVSDDFDYTIVVCDAYDNEIFSIDKYLYSQGSHSHADVAVAPSETVAVSSYHVGETTVYVPYLTGQLGKVYQGIDPIVVNNTEDKISANHVPLGVQDPLYFVQDDEEGCIIGFSGQTVPDGVMTESALEFENNKITGYNGSAFSAGNEYEAGSYVSIDNNTISITGLQPEGDYAYNSALSSKLDVTALPQDLVHSGDLTAYQPAGDYQTAGNYLSATDSANFYPMEGNPSGFLTAHQSLDDYATKQWVEDKGYITGIDIQESASWNEATTVVNNNSAIWNNTTNVVSSNSAAWGSAMPQIPVTGINGIKISESGDQVVFEVSGDYYPGNNPSGFITGVDLSDYATTAQVSEKLDTTAFSDVSGSFQPKSAMSDYALQTDLNNAIYTLSEDIEANKVSNTAVGFYKTWGLTAVTGISGKDISAKSAYFAQSANSAKYDSNGNSLSQTHNDLTALNEFVNINSATWNTVTDKLDTTAFSDVSSTFLTGVDLTPYQLTADMTAYQPAGDYMTTGDSANFYTTANESGFISEVPVGTMNESAFEYNGSNKISAYNGSAFAGGGGGTDLDFGYDESGAISSINTSALSDSRAGTPLYVESPLFTGQSGDSAYIGCNVKDTILWSGDQVGSAFTITLSEPISNFERIYVLGYTNDNSKTRTLDLMTCPDQLSVSGAFAAGTSTQTTWGQKFWTLEFTDTTVHPIECSEMQWGTTTHSNMNTFGILKVVGINRKQV